MNNQTLYIDNDVIKLVKSPTDGSWSVSMWRTATTAEKSAHASKLIDSTKDTGIKS